MKLHPTFLGKNGGREFAVLPYDEFVRLQEALADAADLLELRKAKRRDDPGKPGLSLDELKTQLKSRRPTTSRR